MTYRFCANSDSKRTINCDRFEFDSPMCLSNDSSESFRFSSSAVNHLISDASCSKVRGSFKASSEIRHNFSFAISRFDFKPIASSFSLRISSSLSSEIFARLSSSADKICAPFVFWRKGNCKSYTNDMIYVFSIANWLPFANGWGRDLRRRGSRIFANFWFKL